MGWMVPGCQEWEASVTNWYKKRRNPPWPRPATNQAKVFGSYWAEAGEYWSELATSFSWPKHFFLDRRTSWPGVQGDNHLLLGITVLVLRGNKEQQMIPKAWSDMGAVRWPGGGWWCIEELHMLMFSVVVGSGLAEKRQANWILLILIFVSIFFILNRCLRLR